MKLWRPFNNIVIISDCAGKTGDNQSINKQLLSTYSKGLGAVLGVGTRRQRNSLKEL